MQYPVSPMVQAPRAVVLLLALCCAALPLRAQTQTQEQQQQTQSQPQLPQSQSQSQSQAPVLPRPQLPPEPAEPADGMESEVSEAVQITEAYIELRSGAGRDFPVFYVAGRGQWIAITLRHTDWFKVRTVEGKVGWVNRKQLESTLMASGQSKSFRDVLLDDYLNRRLQLGAAWGQFRSEPMLKFWTSYRLADTLSAEATIGQVQGVFSGTSFWHLNLVSEPWSDQRLSPFFSVGLGRLSNVPNASLVDASTTDAQMANASLGLRYYLNERFVLRGDYTIYTGFVSDTRSLEFRALTAGISFFFY